MSPFSDPARHLPYRAGTAGALALVGLLWPVPAFSLPPGSTTPVIPFETSMITFAGGTAELDGSTTLERTQTGTKSRIDCTILFAKDSDRLRPGAQDKLRRLATQLQRQGPGRVQVTGYTDDLGSAAHGLDLSRRRAQRVATALSDTLPTKTYPMTVQGRGEADPAVPNTSETNRRKNRRVTVILTVTTPRPTTSKAQAPSTTQPNPTPTASPALPTADASAPSPEPTSATTPAVPSIEATPVPTPLPKTAASDPWPTTAAIGLTLVLLGALADQIRRRRGTANGPTRASAPPPKPPEPDNAGATATATATQPEKDSAAPPPPTAVPDTTTTTSKTPIHQHPPDPLVSGLSRTTAPRPAQSPEPQMARLDRSLEAWFSGNTRQPRLTLLGPVQARTHGQALARRKPYYTELLAYLTLKTHGATVDEIADTFGLTTARVRTDMKVLRDWLGMDPTTNQPFLPDARTSPAAVQRGLPTYQVRDVLCDYHLFDQLQTRAARTEPTKGISDLETALRLVTGKPFTHTRTGGWHWIFEGQRLDLQAASVIVTVANAAAQHHQDQGNSSAHRQALAVGAAAEAK